MSRAPQTARWRFAFAPLALAAACGPMRPAVGSTVDSCREGGAELTDRSAAAALVGSYRLSLTATTGTRAGASADGQLALHPADDSTAGSMVMLGLRDTSVRQPLVGSVALDRAAIGAADTGDLESADPVAPGVLVIERRPRRPDAAVEITIRLGAEANRRGRVRYDGGYFALMIRRLGADGFAGTWSSGAGLGEAAGGAFCARRVTP